MQVKRIFARAKESVFGLMVLCTRGGGSKIKPADTEGWFMLIKMSMRVNGSMISSMEKEITLMLMELSTQETG